MYKIEKKENYEIYAFDEIDLRIKIVDNNLLKNVYINYKGCLLYTSPSPRD